MKNNAAIAGIVTFRQNKQRYIRCAICQKYPLIVKRFVAKKAPPITTAVGTRYRAKILNEHIKSAFHNECLKANRIDELKVTNTPMEAAICKANKRMIDYVGKLMIQIFHDAKRLNLSAFSWPSRYIAGEASCAYDSEKQTGSIIKNDISLHYVNPPGHLDLMATIVRSHRAEFLKKIDEYIAISLRIDGSIDLTQLDKIYVMAKVINLDGSSDLVFLGIGQQTERFAKGLMLAVIGALEVFFDDPKLILEKVSSV